MTISLRSSFATCLALSALSALSPPAHAQATPADLVLTFRDPTGTVFSNQPIDVWVTLTNTNPTETFGFDLTLPPPTVPLTSGAWGFGQTSIPTQGFDSSSMLQPFASYTGAGKFTSGSCSADTFVHPTGCDTGPYATSVPAIGNWFSGGDIFSLPGGASVDINLTTLSPIGGNAPAGNYTLSFNGLGVSANGVDVAARALYADIFSVSTCANQPASNCAFTRTVLAVPEPATWLAMLAGLG